MDNKKLRGKPDRSRIAFEQEHERTRACVRYRVSELELLLAIWCGTNQRSDVELMLRSARRKLSNVRAAEKRARARKRKAKPDPALRRVGRAYLAAEKRARRAAGRK